MNDKEKEKEFGKAGEAAPKVFESVGGFQIENQERVPTAEEIAQKQQEEEKKEERKKIALFGLRVGAKGTVLAIVALLLFFGIASLVTFLRRDRTLFEIGDFSFTESDVQAQVKAMQEHMDKNPDVTFGDDLREVAIDNLIFNSALKHYASDAECGVSVSWEDVAQINNIYIPDGLSAEIVLLTRFGEPDKANFNMMRMTNNAYREMLNDCMISQRGILIANIMYDTFYFLGLPEAELPAAYAAARARLREEILPLFEAGAPWEEIMARADFAEENAMVEADWDNMTHEERLELIDERHRRSATQATLTVSFVWVDGRDFFNHVPEHMDDPLLAPVVSLNEAARNLTEVGQHTGLITTTAATFSVARLEALHEGLYNSWDDFEEQMRSRSSRLVWQARINEAVAGILSGHIQDVQACSPLPPPRPHPSGTPSPPPSRPPSLTDCSYESHNASQQTNMRYNLEFVDESGARITETIIVRKRACLWTGGSVSCSETTNSGFINGYHLCGAGNGYEITLPDGWTLAGVPGTPDRHGATHTAFVFQDTNRGPGRPAWASSSWTPPPSPGNSGQTHERVKERITSV